MLYLVSGEINVSYYGHDGRYTKQRTRLVEADDELEAGGKFEKHFSDKSVEYEICYWANAIDVSSIIS